MAGRDIELEPAQLTQAAQHLGSRIPDVVKVMTTMSKTLEDNSEALVGGAGVEMANALNAWATTAAKLPQVLGNYATALAEAAATARSQDMAGEISFRAQTAALSASSLNLD